MQAAWHHNHPIGPSPSPRPTNLHPLAINLLLPQLLPARPQQVFSHLQIGKLVYVGHNNRHSVRLAKRMRHGPTSRHVWRSSAASPKPAPVSLQSPHPIDSPGMSAAGFYTCRFVSPDDARKCTTSEGEIKMARAGCLVNEWFERTAFCSFPIALGRVSPMCLGF
jgi:hypothetical protein